MTKSTIKRLFPNKRWCIANHYGTHTSYWQYDCVWYDHKHAYVGTKREMQIILNKELYQAKLRGAKVIMF